VRCPVHNRSFKHDKNDEVTVCPVTPGDPGVSVIALGFSKGVRGTIFEAKDILNTRDVVSVARYLVYIDTCDAGFEPSFGDAFIARGARNCIAFRKTIPDSDARQMARNFHKKWVRVHKCNPEKIPQVFLEVAPPFFGTMKPKLFGAGGATVTSSTPGAIADAVGTAARPEVID
jgi:hypothetical protein